MLKMKLVIREPTEKNLTQNENPKDIDVNLLWQSGRGWFMGHKTIKSLESFITSSFSLFEITF